MLFRVPGAISAEGWPASSLSIINQCGLASGVAEGVGLVVAAGVALTSGKAAGVAVPIGVGVAVAIALDVGLACGCRFIAVLSFIRLSGRKAISIALFWLVFVMSCGTATTYSQTDPTNLSPFSLNTQRA